MRRLFINFKIVFIIYALSIHLCATAFAKSPDTCLQKVLAELINDNKTANQHINTIRHSLDAAGENRDFTNYGNGMDKSMPEKLALIEQWLPKKENLEIIDVGTGTGNLAGQLALKYPRAKVVGVDLSSEMLKIAAKQNQYKNLEFRLASAHAPFAKDADASIYSSILHEVYSYSGDSNTAVREALKNTFASLRPEGRVIIRDFIAPENGHLPVILSHQKSDMIAGHTFEDFSKQFKRNVPVKVVSENEHEISYLTDMKSAYEFMYRKDYHQDWSLEMKEKYGFWTKKQAKVLLESSGFNVIHAKAVNNPWLVENRLKGKISLLDAKSKKVLPYPDYQMVIVAEKPGLSELTDAQQSLFKTISSRVDEGFNPTHEIIERTARDIKEIETDLAKNKLEINAATSELSSFDKFDVKRFPIENKISKIKTQAIAFNTEKELYQRQEAMKKLDHDIQQLQSKHDKIDQDLPAYLNNLSYDSRRMAEGRIGDLLNSYQRDLSDLKDAFQEKKIESLQLQRDLVNQKKILQKMNASEKSVSDLIFVERKAREEFRIEDATLKIKRLNNKVTQLNSTIWSAKYFQKNPEYAHLAAQYKLAGEEAAIKLEKVKQELKVAKLDLDGASTALNKTNNDLVLQRTEDVQTLLYLKKALLKQQGPPAGITFDGPVYHAGSWEIHGGNIAANHRYSKPKVGALYTSAQEPGVESELIHYGINPKTTKIDVRHIKLKKVLDLTNTETQEALGLTHDQIVRDDYFISQVIGEYGIAMGYDGVKVPSARNPMATNIIAFKGF